MPYEFFLLEIIMNYKYSFSRFSTFEGNALTYLGTTDIFLLRMLNLHLNLVNYKYSETCLLSLFLEAYIYYGINIAFSRYDHFRFKFYPYY